MKDNKGFTLVELMIVIVLICLVLCLVGGVPGRFVKEDVAVRALQTYGFTDVKVIEKNVYFIPLRGGSKEDSVRFVCKARNSAGNDVIVHVFSGWIFKSATVRTPN